MHISPALPPRRRAAACAICDVYDRARADTRLFMDGASRPTTPQPPLDDCDARRVVPTDRPLELGMPSAGREGEA